MLLIAIVMGLLKVKKKKDIQFIFSSYFGGRRINMQILSVLSNVELVKSQRIPNLLTKTAKLY